MFGDIRFKFMNQTAKFQDAIFFLQTSGQKPP
jgi:hypothetical protein